MLVVMIGAIVVLFKQFDNQNVYGYNLINRRLSGSGLSLHTIGGGALKECGGCRNSGPSCQGIPQKFTKKFFAKSFILVAFGSETMLAEGYLARRGQLSLLPSVRQEMSTSQSAVMLCG